MNKSKTDNSPSHNDNDEVFPSDIFFEDTFTTNLFPTDIFPRNDEYDDKETEVECIE